MDERFIRSIIIDWTLIGSRSYLRQIEALKGLETLYFNSPEGGTKNYSFSTYDSHSELYDAMRVVRGSRKARWGYFLRTDLR